VQVNSKHLIDDSQCYQTVRELRWPDGVECLACQSTHVIKRGFDDTEPDKSAGGGEEQGEKRTSSSIPRKTGAWDIGEGKTTRLWHEAARRANRDQSDGQCAAKD
jgi:hypothetical protein